MLLLVSGATKYERTETVGHLIVPKQWNKPESIGLVPGRWAMDNGAYSGFDCAAYMRMLQRFQGYPGCLFVTAPDVVYDAASTLDLWEFWSKVITGLGHRPAFVAQNGIDHHSMPWTEMDALFIGGDDAFKDGELSRSLCGYAKAIGMWVHWGRVNGKRRYELAQLAGADSIDGSGFSMYSDTRIPMVGDWERELVQQPRLL